jgi:hypothetical protein
MNHNTNNKVTSSVGTAVATNASTTLTVDTLGYDQVRFAVFQSISNAAGTLKVEAGATTSAFSSIGLTSGTDFTAATNNSNATTSPYYVFDVAVPQGNRYIRLTHTPAGATANVAIFGIAGRPESGLAQTATAQGANGGYLSKPSA